LYAQADTHKTAERNIYGYDFAAEAIFKIRTDQGNQRMPAIDGGVGRRGWSGQQKQHLFIQPVKSNYLRSIRKPLFAGKPRHI
jgi:hypothetical protein